MKPIKKALVFGDAMIPKTLFKPAYDEFMAPWVEEAVIENWEEDWPTLQNRRLEVEKRGPEIESIPEPVTASGKDAEIIMGLFVPISKKVMDVMPSLRIAGVCRAGLENVNVEEATKKGILVFNVQGRNAEAVSDFAVGMMIAESRNIARAHHAIKTGTWRKTFPNSEFVPQLKGKTIGIIGFGFIGRLVARKLSGFNVNILVYDPYADPATIKKLGCTPADREKLFSESDFITIHARLTDENKGMAGEKEIGMMKKTAYLINTGRAGLVNEPALIKALKENRIAGAALDVFPTEPIPETSEITTLDNVTLTTHIAGTTTEALTKSPGLLMEDIEHFLKGEEYRFMVNPEVLKDKGFAEWFNKVKTQIK